VGTLGEPLRADARRNVDAILVAARDVLAENSNAELATIAARAGVHRVTLYRHFRSREALVEALQLAAVDDALAVALTTNLGADDLLQEVETLIRRLYEVSLTWRSYGWALGYSSGTAERRRRQDLGEVTVALFRAAQQQGLLRQDLSEGELLVTWGAPSIYLSGLIADGHWTLDEVVDYTMRLLKPAAGDDPS